MKYFGDSCVRTTGITALIACCFALACAAPARIETVFESPEYVGSQYERLLVVGVSESRDQRARFEKALVTALAERGVTAISGYKTLADRPLNRDSVEAAARESEADAVLVTRLEHRESRAKLAEKQIAVEKRRREGKVYEFFRYDYDEYREPEELKVATTATLVTDLFETAKGTKVWSAESTSFDKGSAFEVIVEQSDVIADRLKRDGWIK